MVKWKRENVPDHKFDFVDVQEFVRGDFLSRVKYSAVFFMVLKAVLVYLGDLYNAGRLIFVDNGGVITKTKVIPPNIAKWIFVGSVMLSFVLLFIEVRKAKKIIASGDISFAFTNVVAKRYYNLTSFAHWCFFEEITDQLSTLDNLAFFVFFSFKGWKRLLVCDGPRQTINAIFLFTVFSEKGFSLNLSKYGSLLTAASLGVTAFTVIVFAISAFLLAISFLIYLPLLCKIRGNLKEYCCHLIDKRIEKLLKRQRERRIQRAKKGSVNYNGKKPTLPVLDYDDNQPQPPPMMYNNNNYGIPPPGDPYLMGRPNVPRTQTPHSQGMYDYQNKGSMEGGYNAPYKGRRGSDSSQGIVPVSPLYAKNAVAETIDYPQRPDSNNSNSAYSDTSTKYSGQGKIPYQYPPQHQYPYQQMPPPSGFNNVDQHTDQYADQYVDPYNLVDDYQQNSASNPYNYQNDPYSNSNSNQYYGEAYYDNNDYNYNNDYSNYYQPPTPQNAQFAPIESQQQTIIPPSQKNKSPAMYQQNRPYNNKGGRY